MTLVSPIIEIVETKPKPTTDIYKIRYSIPKRTDMAVCFVYFNSMNSKRMLMNYLYTVEKLKLANIKYYTLELYYDQPEIKDAIHLKGESVLFHKENLCQILEKYVSWWYSKLLFLDADIIFENPDWYMNVSKLLDTYEVVHPFEKCCWLDLTYNQIIIERETVLLMDMKKDYNPKYHPGFGWAFRRCWFRKFGFYNLAITGSGDSYSAAAWLGTKIKTIIPALKPSYFIYCSMKKPLITSCPGTVFHLYHGSRENRKYAERHRILDGITDVRKILTKSKNGVYMLTDKVVNKKLVEYFKERDDDGL